MTKNTFIPAVTNKYRYFCSEIELYIELPKILLSLQSLINTDTNKN